MKLATCVMIFVGFAALAGAADARQVYVPGYYRSNGVWVAPHYRTVPDGQAYDGRTYDGSAYEGPAYNGRTYPDGTAYPNVNPYTGQVAPHAYPYGAYPYQAPYSQTPYVPPAAPVPAPYYGAP